MAWIELHQSIWTHKKTLLLAAELGMSETHAVAHLIRLWTWALDNVPTGDLSGLPPKVIAIGAGWDKDPEVFVRAAINAGWFDETDEGLFIHDWQDYAGRLIEKRKANAERMRRARAEAAIEKCYECATHVQCTTSACAGATVPNRTVPNRTEELNTHAPDGASAQPQNPCDRPADQPGEQRKRAKTQKQDELFARFWAAYPKKRSKGQAEKAWAKLQPDEQLVETMLATIERAKKSEEWRKESGRYIPYPATWLNGKRWEDEYTATEVNAHAEHWRHAQGPPAFGSTAQAKNRFAGLARDGGTGRVVERPASPNTGRIGQTQGNTGESASDNESHKVSTGVSMA